METLQQMTAETTRLKDATAALKADEKGLRASLRDHTSLTPLPELKASVAALQQGKEAMSARLAKLKDGQVKPITAEERDKVSVEHSKWKKLVASRRKIRGELWKIIADAVEPHALAETKEKLGLESF
jgi:26S proteasome regulatory subunit (ATPase 3-interacting protein)